MAELTTFVFSENIEQVPNPSGTGTSLNIINPQNVFRPMFIPGTFSFSLTFGLIDVDTTKDHIVNFKLVYDEGENESNNIVVDTNNMNIPANPTSDKKLPKEVNGIMFNLDFRNVPFRKAGKYFGIISLDGQEIAKKVLFVYPQESI
jgi:hypothetical protein